MPTIAIVIPADVLAQYDIKLSPVDRLDDSGEFCRHCDREHAYVDVQFYAQQIAGLYGGSPNADETGQVFDSCCVDCLGTALADCEVDPHHTVTVEHERHMPAALEGAPVSRPVNLNSPDYQVGVDAANLFLDTGMGVNVPEWLGLAEMAADRAHRREDVQAYHRMRGMIATLREYQQDRAT